MSSRNWVVMAAMAIVVAACGGGGGADKPPFASSGNGSSNGNGGSSGSGDGSVTTNTAGTVVMTLSRSAISATQSATVTALVKNAAGVPSPGVIVTFGLAGSSGGIGQVSPLTAITDALGQATTSLSPTSGTSSGAAYVTASADVGATALTSKATFTVNPISVTLDAISTDVGAINGYGSAVITVAVTGASPSNPLTVKLTSPCSDAGKAVITPTSVVVTGASATATYQDKACGASDAITGLLSGTSQQQQATLVVQAPAATGIQFLSVDNTNICLSGTGCPANANVTFKVVDATGTGKAGVLVDFSLDASISAFADLGSSYGLTAADGSVSVTVSSKQTPTPLRVTARVNGSVLQTISNQLTISGGLPVASNNVAHSGMSLAVTKSSLDYNLDGDSATLNVRLTDRYSAPAINGTAVSFVSDGGSVVPAYCVTTNGSCSVNLIVSNPRPANGRVHVVAYVKGQEYFVDLDSDGTRDSGESFDDVPVGVCLDKDENAACSTNEFLVGVSTNPDLGNGTWDGQGTAFARKQALFFFSRTASTPRLYQVFGGVCTSTLVDNAYMTVTMGGARRQYIEVCVRDGNTNADALGGNPIVSGGALSASTLVDKISLAFSNTPVPAVLSGPSYHLLTITNTSNPLAAISAGGTADITIDLNGESITFLDAVTIIP